jgi:hypothetical protein
MPSSGHTIVESPSLIEAFARSPALVDPLRRHRLRRATIREFFRPWDPAHAPLAICLTRPLRPTQPGKSYSIPIDSSRLSSMNSIRTAPVRLFFRLPTLFRRSTPDRILFIIGIIVNDS